MQAWPEVGSETQSDAVSGLPPRACRTDLRNFQPAVLCSWTQVLEPSQFALPFFVLHSFSARSDRKRGG